MIDKDPNQGANQFWHSKPTYTSKHSSRPSKLKFGLHQRPEGDCYKWQDLLEFEKERDEWLGLEKIEFEVIENAE